MMIFFSLIHNLRNYRFYLALFLGGALGLFAYSNWLVDILPPVSAHIFFYVLLLTLGGWIASFYLLERWLVPQIIKMSGISRGLLIGWSLFAGTLLLMIFTRAWQSSSRLVFLLPPQSLEIKALNPGQTSDVAIFQVTSSLGTTSFDAINHPGWERQGDFLVLRDLSNNRFIWTGRTGEQVSIIFRKSPEGGQVGIAWNNGEAEVMNLSSTVEGRYIYTHSFDVPFYASKWVVLGLGVLVFSFIVCLLSLFAWRKRSALLSPGSTAPIPATEEKTPSWHWRLDGIILAALLVAAVLLRVFNLNSTFPQVDEYKHLMAAQSLISGASLSSVYQRSLLIVTLPAAFLFRVFGVYPWSARIAGVLVNSLAVVPVYLLSRKVNRSLAVLSAGLYVMSPWMIAISRIIREYAYYPFFFYWIIFGMIEFIAEFPNDFIPSRDWKKLLKPKLVLLAAFLLLPPIYSWLDKTSTFALILFAYLLMVIVLFGKLDLEYRGNKLLVYGVSVILLLTVYFFLSQSNRNFDFPAHFNDSILAYFWGSPQQQWYYGRPFILPAILVVCSLFFSVFYRRRNFIPLYFLLLFIGYSAFFIFFFNPHIFPRYLVSLEMWYIVILAFGFFCTGLFLRTYLNKVVIGAIIALLFLLTINPAQVMFPTFFKNGGMPITEEYYDDIGPVNLYLLDHAKQEDVLIATYYRYYVYFTGAPKFAAVQSFNSKDDIFSVVRQYPSGWIVISVPIWSDSNLLPLTAVSVQNKIIKYVGQFADQYLWHWSLAASP